MNSRCVGINFDASVLAILPWCQTAVDWEVKIADFGVLLGKDVKKVTDTNDEAKRKGKKKYRIPLIHPVCGGEGIGHQLAIYSSL